MPQFNHRFKCQLRKKQDGRGGEINNTESRWQLSLAASTEEVNAEILLERRTSNQLMQDFSIVVPALDPGTHSIVAKAYLL